jgi:hypothetical protein
MKLVQSSRLLKTALTVDALSGAGTATLQLLMPSLVADQLGLPMALLLETGLFLLAFAALLVFLASRERVAAWLIWAIVIGNVGWSASCVLLWATGLVTPSPLGIGFLLLQAGVVLALAAWEAVGLRASRPLPSAGVAAAH